MTRFQQAILPIAALLFVLVLGVLLAGCGDSKDAPELTEEEEQALLEEAIAEADGDLAVLDSAAVETETAAPGSTMERGVPLTTPVARGTGPGPEMGLTLVAGGYCTGVDCFVDSGSMFTLAVEVLEAPAGYILLQTFIDYGVYDSTADEDGAGPGSCGDGIENGRLDGADRMDSDCTVLELTYFPTTSAADEMFWTDLEPATAVRAELGPGLVGHGGITGLIPPLLESAETGIVVRIQLSCPSAATTVPISLLVYDDPLALTNGSAFVGPDGGLKIIPTVVPINLHCVAP